MSTALKKTHSADLKGVARPTLRPTAAGATRLFFNRELSLLQFHKRVLEEALDQTNPVLERLKLLSIFSANLDELLMICVSRLKSVLVENVVELSDAAMALHSELKEM